MVRLLNFLKKFKTWCKNVGHIEGMIKCASCGKSIIPGDPITLQPMVALNIKNNFVIKAKTGKMVCCFRKSCRRGHKIDGYWTNSGVESDFYNW